MKTPRRILLASAWFALIGLIVASYAMPLTAQEIKDARVLSADQLREERAYTLGTTAYLWGFTMNELYRVRASFLAQPGNAVNKLFNESHLVTPEVAAARGVVRANSATLYSIAWLDLSAEPVVLEFPAISNRYFTFNYVDYYQRNENLSNATIGRVGGAYAFVGPNWKGALPEKLHRVDVGTNTVWIVGRIEAKGLDDVKNVTAIQEHCSVTTLGEWVGGRRNSTGNTQYADWPAYDLSNPLNYFVLLNEGLRRNPPSGADLVMLGLFESLDLGPNKTFDPAKLDPATAAGLKRAAAIGERLLKADFNARLGRVVNQWQVTPDLGRWQTPDTGQLDFLLRSAIAKEAQPGQNASEAIYAFAFNDAEGRPLAGASRYVLRFPPGQLPPVNAFWSVTLYDEHGFAVKNVLSRTQLGTYDRLTPGVDGSVTIYLQHESPGAGNEGNWLPVPEGPFNLGLRLYNPGPAALTQDWTPPAVERVK